MKTNKGAFTLVELIVVITILAILATIWFVSFSWYLAWTRDTNRVAQLKSMSDALELYRTKKDLPIPDDKVDIQYSWTTIAYQWYIGKNVLETIEYTESWLDPKEKIYFSYYLTKNKKYFQLLAFLEEPSTDLVALNNVDKSFATDYSDKYPYTKWKKLWVLIDINNTPIQEIETITSSWFLDIYNTNSEYKAIFKNDILLKWTWSRLQYIKNWLSTWWLSNSCLTLISKNSSLKNKDWIYLLNLEWNNVLPVYCDMTNAWWGWTLVASQWPIVWDTVTDDFWPITLDNPWKMLSLEKINLIPHHDFWVTQKKTHNPTNDYKYSYNIWYDSTETGISTNSDYFKVTYLDCKVKNFVITNWRINFEMLYISDGTPCHSWLKYKPSWNQDNAYASNWDPVVTADLIHWQYSRISDFEYYAFWIR